MRKHRTMQWHKLGPASLPTRRPAWMVSHAAVPFAEVLDASNIRIYFSSRDASNRSHAAWAVVNLKEPNRILEISSDPVLTPGALGCFDDSGAMLSWITEDAGRRMLYYIGWNLGVTVPFRNAIGLAVSTKGEEFVRFAEGPIVDRTPLEPHFVASCCVVRDGPTWRMWYVGCVGWKLVAAAPRHYYHIRYAESRDGIEWRRDGTIAINFERPDEYAISRPSVIKEAGEWRMWYSYRGQRYSIGYAESADGRAWQRHDEVGGLRPSTSGWDSEMVEYPHVFDAGGRRYMVYNGNDYGRSGFGLAVLE